MRTLSKYKILLIMLAFSLFTSYSIGSRHPIIHKMDNSYTDLVPNEKTAIAIAEAIWLPLYGKKVKKEKPFKATLYDSVWIVEGYTPKESKGGSVVIKILKKNCKVIGYGWEK